MFLNKKRLLVVVVVELRNYGGMVDIYISKFAIVCNTADCN
jgi:hypothetical protein